MGFCTTCHTPVTKVNGVNHIIIDDDFGVRTSPCMLCKYGKEEKENKSDLPRCPKCDKEHRDFNNVLACWESHYKKLLGKV